MSIILNGTNLTRIFHNNVDLEEVYYGNTLVWAKRINDTVNYPKTHQIGAGYASNGSGLCRNTGTDDQMGSCTQASAHVYPSFTSGVINGSVYNITVVGNKRTWGSITGTDQNGDPLGIGDGAGDCTIYVYDAVTNELIASGNGSVYLNLTNRQRIHGVYCKVNGHAFISCNAILYHQCEVGIEYSIAGYAYYYDL